MTTMYRRYRLKRIDQRDSMPRSFLPVAIGAVALWGLLLALFGWVFVWLAFVAAMARLA